MAPKQKVCFARMVEKAPDNSHGSIAILLRCGGICSDHSVTDLPLNIVVNSGGLQGGDETLPPLPPFRCHKICIATAHTCRLPHTLLATPLPPPVIKARAATGGEIIFGDRSAFGKVAGNSRPTVPVAVFMSPCTIRY